MSALVSVIIPAWNLWNLTRDCLHSLVQYTAPGDIEVIVVDNGSTDDTVTELAPLGETLWGAHFKAVRLPENRGFAKGCNAGAKAAAGEYLFFLNNDTLVTENWLPPLQNALVRNPKLGMVGPLLLYPETREVQHCGVVVEPSPNVLHLYDNFPGHHPLIHKPRTLQAITGAALYMTACVFWECGGFHEGYINGFEDLDLCCAVREKGLHMTCIPESVILHRTSQTPGRFAHDVANSKLLKERWPKSFVPDLHRFLLHDGYIPVFGPRLTLYGVLPQAKEDALTQAFVRAFDAERCVARLATEPLWQGGYTLLAEHLEKAGQWAEACVVRQRQVHFFPLLQHCTSLARTAARAGNKDMVDKASDAMHSITGTTARQYFHYKARQWLEICGDSTDTALPRLFTEWLARYGE